MKFSIPAWSWIALAGTVFWSIMLYPGALNSDSSWQLAQGRSGEYNNWHPVIMSFLWRYLDRVIVGSGAMFLFHVTVFWVALGIYIELVFQNVLARVVSVLAVALFLPLVAAFMMVVKDVGTVAAFCFSCAMLLKAQTQRSRGAWVLGIVGLFYALAVRHNAFSGVFPLAIWAGVIYADIFHPYEKKWILTPLRSLGIGTLLFTGIVTSVIAFERFVIHPKQAYVSQGLMLFDIVAVSIDRKADFVPAFYARQGEPPLTMAEMRTLFVEDDCTRLLWPPPGLKGYGFLQTGLEFTPLLAAWRSVLLTEPGPYLNHRWRVFKKVLGFDIAQNWPYWFPSFDALLRENRFNAPVKIWIINIANRYRQTPMFKSSLYISLLLLCGVAGYFWEIKFPAAFWMIFASAVCYELAYFVLATAIQFRYSWWPMVASLMLPMLLRIPRKVA